MIIFATLLPVSDDEGRCKSQICYFYNHLQVHVYIYNCFVLNLKKCNYLIIVIHKIYLYVGSGEENYTLQIVQMVKEKRVGLLILFSP